MSSAFGPEPYTNRAAGSMQFCVELDSIKDTGVPIHQPAALPVAAGWLANA